MKGASFSIGFLLLFLGGTSLGAAVAFGFGTSDALPFCIASGVCFIMSTVCFWLAHRNGEDKADVHDYLMNLQEGSEIK